MPAHWFQSFKLEVVSAVALSKDALHIYVGLGVFLAAAMIFRRPLASFLPIVLVVIAAVAGELFDMRGDLATFGSWRWQASFKDLVNTTLWPAVLWMLARAGALRTHGAEERRGGGTS